MQQAQVKEGTIVTIEYKLITTGAYGEKCEVPPATCSFVYGVEAQYPSVETALLNKRPGDRIHVYVPPEEIFGNYDETPFESTSPKQLIVCYSHKWGDSDQ